MRITAFIGSLLLAMSAQAVTMANPTNEMIRYYSPPHEFHLFSHSGDKFLNFDSAKTVRICAGEDLHMTGLKITHDGSNSVVKAGRCNSFTARNFEISPDGTVKGDYDLEGTVEMKG